MATDHRSACFIVGYDGSAASLAAVREAARRAGPSDRVIVVHAYEPPSDALGWPLYESAERQAIAAGNALVDGLRGHPALASTHWTGEVVGGPTAEVIDAAARNHGAEAIYIGSRGAGRASALLGSVAHDVLHLADRPVVVIPERAVGNLLERAAARVSG